MNAQARNHPVTNRRRVANNEESSMKRFGIASIVVTAALAGCATSPEQIECLQPNWRVAIEVNGTKPGLPPKPEAKPGAKPEAKPEAGAEAKPAPKPKPQPVMVKTLVQGNSAFNFKSAVLNEGGKAELDKFVKMLNEGSGNDKRPTTPSSIVISGHSDTHEANEGDNSLSEARAKAVRDYLVSKGVDQKVMFWEGVGSKQPIPVTKFCAQ